MKRTRRMNALCGLVASRSAKKTKFIAALLRHKDIFIS